MNNIMRYLNVDCAYIRDEFSKNVLSLYHKGCTEEEIIKYINNNK
jgi:hypothetical protein